MNDVVIGIGSNIDASRNIKQALHLLSAFVEIVKVSEILQTTPIGITNQAIFSNAAVYVQSKYNSKQLNGHLKYIEDQLGRDRTRPKYGSREIDLDIVVYNGEIVDDDYYERDFLQKLVLQLIEFE